MKWNRLSEKVPTKENEGDYFLIKEYYHPTPTIVKVEKRVNTNELCIRYKESGGGIDMLLSKWEDMPKIHLFINEVYWKRISNNEKMAYL